MAKKIVRFLQKNRVQIIREESFTIGLFPDKDEVEITCTFELAEFFSDQVARCCAFSAGPTSQKAMNNCTYRSARLSGRLIFGEILCKCGNGFLSVLDPVRIAAQKFIDPDAGPFA